MGKNPGWFALALRRGGNIPLFPDEPEEKGRQALSLSFIVRDA